MAMTVAGRTGGTSPKRRSFGATLLPLACVTLLGSGSAGAELVPVGNPIAVTDDVGGSSAAIALASTGETLAVWTEGGFPDSDVFGRLFAADGTPVGTKFMLATWTTGQQSQVNVTADGSGHFIAVWHSEGRDGDGYGIAGQRFDASGAPVGTEFVANTYTTGDQRTPTVDATSDGRFVVAWGTSAQRFDATGAKLGPEIAVTSDPGGNPHVALDGAGNFVVAWASEPSHFVNFQRFAADGSPAGPAALNVAAQGPFDVAMAPDGKLVLTWSSGNTGPCDVMGRRYDSSGTPMGADFAVSTDPNGFCVGGSVEVDGTGGFVIGWYQGPLTSQPRDGALIGAFAQRYDAAGTPDPRNLRVNRYRRRDDFGPAIALDANGNAVMSWAETLNPSHFIEKRWLVRFCQDDDPTCDRCPGADDSLDGDADGIPDGCDLCTNAVGEQTLDPVRVAAIDHHFEPGFSGFYKGALRLSGTFRLGGAPGAFGSIDPIADGMRFRFAAPDGAIVLEATLGPGAFGGRGTAGWKLVSRGRRWVYRDARVNPPFEDGVLRAAVEDRSQFGEPNLAHVIVRGRRGSYQVVGEDVVVDATVAFGDQTASIAGRCAETRFIPSQCTFRSSPPQDKMSCYR